MKPNESEHDHNIRKLLYGDGLLSYKDKNGNSLKEGDRIRIDGKWEYKIIRPAHGELMARGTNLHHSELLRKLNLADCEKL
jgi:hypothetical protein